MALVVSDTSPVRALAHLGLLDLLPNLFRDVLIPPCVAAELLRSTALFSSLDVRVLPFVEVRAPSDRAAVMKLRREIDPGESEAIILAMEVRPERLLIDESAGRAVARRMGIMPLGVLGLPVRAKQAGLISAVGPLMERLVKEIDLRVAPSVRLDVLTEAGE